MNDNELIRRITAQLDDGVERLDGATRSRLTQARHRALAPNRHRTVWVWPAAGGALLASVVAMTLWMGREPVVANESFAAADFEMLTEGDTIELYQEMDFLEWLEEADGNGAV